MKTVLSGIKPTGIPTLGNYLGAMKYFVKLQNEMSDHEFLIFVADLHALTTPQDPKELKEKIRKLSALYMACGLNETNLILFIQSEVKAHVELGYLMQSIVYMGELERMTQYKDKKQKQVEGVSTALLTYPVLMAGDILLYNADAVPVGADQKQHLELTRNLAERFNNKFGETFKIPEPIIQKTGAKIMSLQEPTKKMSKSDVLEKASIFILDNEAVIRKKIASAVTDCDGTIAYDPINKPGISNLLTIYSCCKKISIEDALNECKDLNYGQFKSKVADSVVEILLPINKRYQEIINDNNYLDCILDNGRDKASYFARKTIAKVKRKIGVGRKK